MKFYKLTAILVILFSGILQIDAQPYFQKTISTASGNDIGYSICKTSDGYFLAGRTNGAGAGLQDIMIVKTDLNGDVLFIKNVGGAGNDIAYSIDNTADGGCIVTGSTTSFGAGGMDVIAVKLDDSGNVEWTKTFGGGANDEGISVEETFGGGFLIGAIDRSLGAGGMDFYFIKLDMAGNLQWSKTVGGGNNDEIWQAIQAPDSSYIATGSTATFGTGLNENFMVKLDKNGNYLWSKTYGNSSTGEGGSGIVPVQGGFLVCGNSSLNGGNAIHYKIDSIGNLLWAKGYGGTAAEKCETIIQTSDGNFLISGSSSSSGFGLQDLTLYKIDGAGNILFSKRYGGSANDIDYDINHGPSIVETPSGGIMSISASSSFGTNQDYYFLSLDQTANVTCNNATSNLTLSTLSFVTTNPSPTVRSHSNIQTANPSSGFFTNSVTTNTLCSTPISSFSASDTNLCPNSCISFISQVPPSTSVYLWSFPGATPSTSTDANPVNICYSNSGSYNVELTYTDGGISHTLTMSSYITVKNIINFTIDIAICQGQSYFAGGANQTTSGTYYDTYTASNGCDSIVETILTVLPVVTETVSPVICQGQSYFAGGANQTTSGGYIDILTSSSGCDSILYTFLTVLNPINTSDDTTICIGSTIDGIAYFSDTTLNYFLTASSGCDSLVTFSIYVIQCCNKPELQCNTITITENQDLCGAFNVPQPTVISNCSIISLTNDYAGGAFPAGTTTVTWIAENSSGLTDTCEQTIIYEPLTLLTSYTILATESAEMKTNNNVTNGAVGITSASGFVTLGNNTQVAGLGSFVSAPIINTFPLTQISNTYYTEVSTTLPLFESNTGFPGINVSVPTNGVITLTDTVYGRIQLSKGATVIFDNPYGVVNLTEIKVNNKAAGSNTTIKFNQCTKVRVKERIDLGPQSTINPDSINVIFFVAGSNITSSSNQPTVDLGPGATVYADFFVPDGRFYVHSGSNNKPAVLKGLFIAKWIYSGPNVSWNHKGSCDFSYNCILPSQRISQNLKTNNFEAAAMSVYPNPTSQTTHIAFKLKTDNVVSICIYDVAGQVTETIFENQVVKDLETIITIDLSNYSPGVYFIKLSGSTGVSVTKRIFVIE